MRSQVAIVALFFAAGAATTAGFFISLVVGLFCLAACAAIIAIAFGLGE